MFLEIDGIEGESSDHANEGAIDVLAWGWGGENFGTMHIARGGGHDESTFRDIAVRKFVDAATPPLWLAVASGLEFRQVRLTLRRVGETSEWCSSGPNSRE